MNLNDKNCANSDFLCSCEFPLVSVINFPSIFNLFNFFYFILLGNSTNASQRTVTCNTKITENITYDWLNVHQNGEFCVFNLQNPDEKWTLDNDVNCGTDTVRLVTCGRQFHFIKQVRNY